VSKIEGNIPCLGAKSVHFVGYLPALTEPWSTGQVEGQITRLKLLKRQMYDSVGECLASGQESSKT
jgi:hypothetical protein